MGSTAQDPTLQAIFETEVSEVAAALQEHLLRIEADATGRPQRLVDMLRLAHDVKGSASVMGAESIAHLAHALEALLMTWRARPDVVAAEVDRALRASDLLSQLAADGVTARDGTEAAAEALRRKAQLLCAELDAPAGQPAHANTATSAPAARASGVNGTARARETLRVARNQIDTMAARTAFALVHDMLLAERYRSMQQRVRELRRLHFPDHSEGPNALARARVELQTAISNVCMRLLELGEVVSQMRSEVRYLDDAAHELGMVPVSPLVNHLERVARETAELLGRRVRVDVVGRDIRLDKGLIEALKGPLTHAVRNAIDHGIELPEERVAAGKAAEGLLRLELREEAGALHVVLEDDGRGIDRDAVRARLGEAARGLEDKELLALLSRAGVSTRETATEISGRGIGLGAMAALADSMRGEMTLTSETGRGTKLSVQLPLNVSLLDGTIVWAGALPLVLPMSAVCQVAPVDVRAPAQSLSSLFGIPDAARATHVVTIRGRDRTARLGVTRLGSRTEVVQYPVGAHLGRVPLISGVTLLPDSPAWIVDPRELVEACGPEPVPCEDVPAAPRRILLVDDSRSLLALLDSQLSRLGYDVVRADDGEVALDRIAALSFDAVVSDVEMPRLDGFGLLQKCAGKLPVVLISSRSDDETARRAEALGAAAFLVKDPTLGSRVEAVLADLFSQVPERIP